MKNQFGTFAHVFGEETFYLCFLHFDSDKLPDAMQAVRKACRSKGASLSDLKTFLAQSGWREHLVTCAAALAHRDLALEITEDLWFAFDHGSWVSPQIAVTLWLCDPRFGENAQRRIEDLCVLEVEAIAKMPPLERHVIAGTGSTSERAAKAVSALIYLHGLSSTSRDWLGHQLKRREMKALLERDVDRGGIIAEKWLERIRDQSGLLQLPSRD